MSSETASSGLIVKMLPTTGVAVASFFGIPLQEWTYIVAILVGLTQIIYTGYCFYLKWRDKSKVQED